ncbi:MAG: 30S ribosomal protein S20 [Thermoanaerobaculia bacterium]|nr:30S ribosomal protein S20 [Thermoanaerobaculia bacterium]
MANIKSAEKRLRQSHKNRGRNRNYRTRMRSAVRRLREAVQAGDRANAEQLLPETLRLIDSTAGKGIVHRNAAARAKSRLSRAVRSLAE